MNVNLSALQLGDDGLPDFIATSLAASGIPPRQLGLEITETVVIDDNPEHVARLLQIKRLGRAACCSTTSAPATRRSATCAGSRSTC